MSKKTVLITGCSSGFGKLIAKTFQHHGWNVVATMRSPEKETELEQSDSLLVTRLDVIDQQSIELAIAQANEKFGQVDALVNNAGYGGHGMFEQFDINSIERMFDTNVYGPMRTVKALMPAMREQGGGSIVNVTSMAGIIGLPFASTYSASKFAVQGWSEGLALESAPFNVKVHTVAPGAYGTNFNAATDDNFEAGDEGIRQQALVMANHFAQLAEQMQKLSGADANPQEVADLVYACVTEDKPIHNVVGTDANMLMGMKTEQEPTQFLQSMSNMLIPN